MADVSAQEQLMLELVNRARMDPDAEAARFGMTLNQGIPAGSITSTPKQVLAMNQALHTAADNHSEYMHLNDHFSHTENPSGFGFTGVNPGDRLVFAGYAGATSQGENIAWRGAFPGPINLTTAIIQQHEDLFRSNTGHRQNLMADNWREVGIGQDEGTFLQNGTQYSSSLVTQNFAYRGANYYLTGVVYQDSGGVADFYDVGEGTGGVTVNVDGGAIEDTSSAAGGYEVALANGNRIVQIGTATVSVTMANRNIKLDFVNGNQIWTDSDLSIVSGAPDVRLLGARNVNILGSGANEQLVGNRGNNTLVGGAGADTLFGMAGNDILIGGAGIDTMDGGSGNDTFDVGADAETIADASGVDTMLSTVSRNLVSFAAIENLTLQGAAAINGTGNASANIIIGNDAANILNGGAGLDTLEGRLGNDTYVLGAENDLVIDTGGATDTITSTISRNLGFYAAIEYLVLEGGANINGTGNASANVIWGNDANNILDGAGGADSLIGRGGNDVYVLGAENDAVNDTSGRDTIFSTITRSLTSYTGIEDLILQGAGAINGTGNGGFNSIVGNGAQNILAGQAGNDVLVGGGGNDYLFGQANQDSLEGGLGDDFFVYQTMSDTIAGPTCDIIRDFKDFGADKINLQGVFGGTLNYIDGGGPFTGVGQVREIQSGANLVIAVNLSGDAIPEMQILLNNTTAAMVSGADFLL